MIMTTNEIRKVGMAVLIKALGPAGTSRFIQQFEIGRGDYTRDRHQWLDKISAEEVLNELKLLEKEE